VARTVWSCNHVSALHVARAGEKQQDMIPDTGHVRADLFAVLRAAADRLAGPFGEAARGLIAETLADPEATRSARDHLESQRNRMIATVLERAVKRGQVGPQALTLQLISLAPALVSHHFLLHGAPIENETLNDILDHVVMPLMRP